MDDQETLEREVIEEDGEMPPLREVFLYFLMLGFINIGCGLCFEPRSRGLPAGLLDQPFYGWVKAKRNLPQPASAGLLIEALALQKRPVLKRWIESTLTILLRLHPALKSAGLVTLRESPMNRAQR